MKNFITVTTKPAHEAVYTIPSLCTFDTSIGGPLSIKYHDCGYGTVKISTDGICKLHFNGKKVLMGSGTTYEIGERIELGSLLIVGDEGTKVAVTCTYGTTYARWTEQEPEKFTEILQHIDF